MCLCASLTSEHPHVDILESSTLQCFLPVVFSDRNSVDLSSDISVSVQMLAHNHHIQTSILINSNPRDCYLLVHGSVNRNFWLISMVLHGADLPKSKQTQDEWGGGGFCSLVEAI